jgi:hypothetical protein
MRLLPQPEALRQGRFGWPDLMVILPVLTLLTVMTRVGTEAMVRFQPPIAEAPLIDQRARIPWSQRLPARLSTGALWQAP